MEGSGRRQLTGEPTFLTQVPKQSDANTPSALPIAFIDSLLPVPSPFREGALRRQCVLSTWVHLRAWIKGTTPGGSRHSPAFADAHGEQVAVTTHSNKFLFFLSLPHSLQLGFQLE